MVTKWTTDGEREGRSGRPTVRLLQNQVREYNRLDQGAEVELVRLLGSWIHFENGTDSIYQLVFLREALDYWSIRRKENQDSDTLEGRLKIQLGMTTIRHSNAHSK